MGGNESKAHNTISNTMTSTITNTMESSVKSDLAVKCDNLQRVEDAYGCDIQFGPQTCNALGMSNLVTNQQLTANLTQEMTSKLAAQSNAVLEGLKLSIGDSSEASNWMSNIVTATITNTQTFLTECSRNITPMNEQTVKGCFGSKIRFAEQDATAEGRGDCTANHTANMEATQKLSATIDASATSTMKGLDLLGFFLLIFLFFLPIVFIFKFFVGLIKGVLTAPFSGSGNKDNNNNNNGSGSGNGSNGNGGDQALRSDDPRVVMTQQLMKEVKTSTLVLIVLLLVVIMLVLGLIWPGAMAAKLKIWPHRPFGVDYLPTDENDKDNKKMTINYDKDPYYQVCNTEGKVDRSLYVNETMWVDSMCLRKYVNNPDAMVSCTEDEKLVHYKACGVFSGKCQDPQLASDLDRFKKASGACSALMDLPDGLPLQKHPNITCNANDVAFAAFEKGNGKAPENEEDSPYPGCRQCVSTNGDAEVAGFWRHNDGACKKDKISTTAYLEADGVCDSNDPNCFTGEQEFIAKSPDECRDAAYQVYKRKVSQIITACGKVQETTMVTAEQNGGKMPRVKDQCPPSISTYFNCDTGSKRCAYKAKDPNNTEEVASCTNDIDGCCTFDADGKVLSCVDGDLFKDMKVAQQVEEVVCLPRKKILDFWEPYGIVGVISFVAFIFLVIVFVVFRSDSLRGAMVQTVIGARWNFRGSGGDDGDDGYAHGRRAPYVMSKFTLLLVVIGFGVSFVYLSAVNEWPSNPFKSKSEITSYIQQMGNGVTIAMWAVFVFCCLSILAFIMQVIKYGVFKANATVNGDGIVVKEEKKSKKKKDESDKEE